MIIDGVIKPEIIRNGPIDFLLTNYYRLMEDIEFRKVILPYLKDKSASLKEMYKKLFETTSIKNLNELEESYKKLRGIIFKGNKNV